MDFTSSLRAALLKEYAHRVGDAGQSFDRLFSVYEDIGSVALLVMGN